MDCIINGTMRAAKFNDDCELAASKDHAEISKRRVSEIPKDRPMNLNKVSSRVHSFRDPPLPQPRPKTLKLESGEKYRKVDLLVIKDELSKMGGISHLGEGKTINKNKRLQD